MGLGWICKDKVKKAGDAASKKEEGSCTCYDIPHKSKGKAFLGWLITALAISLGSPFWFDILNKLVKVRGSGLIPGATAQQAPPSTPQAKDIPPNQRKG